MNQASAVRTKASRTSQSAAAAGAPRRIEGPAPAPVPRIAAHIDARQAAARIEIWRNGDVGFDALIRAGEPPALALRRLALAHWSSGNPRLASVMLATAAAIAPERAEIWLDLAFTLQAIGEAEEARGAFELSLAIDPSPGRAWLGLAVLANQLHDPARAEEAFAAALERDGALADAAFGLALIAFEQRRYDEAAERFRLALDLGSQNPLALVGLGQSLFFIGDFFAAARSLAVAAAAHRNEASLAQRYGLARYLEIAENGEIDAAERAYAEAAGPHAETARAVAETAFHILSAYGRREAALKVAQARLESGAGDPVRRYLVRVVAGEAFDRAPDDYLVAHFNAFADHFDQQLVEVLGYRAPQQLSEMIAATGCKLKRVLDLGCGTGLAGPLLRPGRDRLVGVDLSKRMLEKAAERDVYDALIETEMLTYLRTTDEQFDLILVADALVYIGNLEPFFAAAARATVAGALVAFNLETTEAAPYRLLPSGRFAHDLNALPGMAGPWFRLKRVERTLLRSEANHKVEGALILMERRGASSLSVSRGGAAPATLAA